VPPSILPPADKLLQQVLPHLLSGTALQDCQLSSESEVRIQMNAAQPQPDGTFSTEYVEHFCMQLLSTLAQALFRQRPSTLREFGTSFWGAFVQQYQAAFLQQVQGSTVALLQARQESARLMEQQAVAMGLAEPGEAAARGIGSSITRNSRTDLHVCLCRLASVQEVLGMGLLAILSILAVSGSDSFLWS
jgi:hypothetical protein